MELSELALRLALALAIGLIVGIERGWHDRDEGEGQRTAGVRTFSLIGLMGGIIGALPAAASVPLVAVAFATLGLTLGAFMWREGHVENDYSATSLIAAMLTFALGVYAVLGDTTVAAGAAVATTVLLANKKWLHERVARITWVELRSGLVLAAMTFIALPLLPDSNIGPFGSFNPHELWLMTILIAGISFIGYASVKIAGHRRGLLLSAAFGGLIASTAVTLALSRMARDNAAHTAILASGVLAAGAVMFIRMLMVAGLLNPPLAVSMAPALAAGAAAMGLSAFYFARRDSHMEERDGGEFTLTNPFSFIEVLRFGALLSGVTVAAAVVRHFFGDAGLLPLGAIAGLADVDAMTLSIAKLENPSALAAHAVLLTAGVNTLVKSVYAWVTGGAVIGRPVLAGSALAVAAGAAASALV